MNEELLTLQDILGTLRRHRKMVAVVVVACTVAGFGVAKALPKKFKSTAQLNLQATYFEVPLLNDSIVGSRDPGEMQAQKQALFRLALSNEFLDAEGEKLGLYKSGAESPERLLEREGLRKNIDYFSATTTTFQLSVVGKTANISYHLASDVLDHIISVLVEERQKNIRTYRESLRKQVESLGIAMSASGAPSAGAQPQVLKEELAKLQAEASALAAQFTADHPKVIAVNERIRSLRQMLVQAEAHPSAPAPSLMEPEGKGRRSEVAGELLKKINYLDIALELEANKRDLPYLEILERPVPPSSAFFPKTGAFVIGGLMAGLLLAGLALGFLELKRAARMTPQTAARMLEVPFLGALPPMIQTGSVLKAVRPAPDGSEEDDDVRASRARRR